MPGVLCSLFTEQLQSPVLFKPFIKLPKMCQNKRLWYRCLSFNFQCGPGISSTLKMLCKPNRNSLSRQCLGCSGLLCTYSLTWGPCYISLCIHSFTVSWMFCWNTLNSPWALPGMPLLLEGYRYPTDWKQSQKVSRFFLLVPKTNPKQELQTGNRFLTPFFSLMTYLRINCQMCFSLKSTRWHGSPGLPE